jgi:AcrR family transcriptional regulator
VTVADFGASPRRARSGRRAGRRREDVLVAAAGVIAARGADATRFADVAEASGVPISTLQYYFGSREDMLVAAFRAASATELTALAAEVDAGDRDEQGQLELIVTAALGGYVPSGKGAGQLWIESWHFALRDPEMREDVLADYAAWRRLIEEIVTAGADAGRWRPSVPPAQVAVTTLALVDGFGPALALADPALTLETAVAAVLETLGRLLPGGS